MAMAAVFFPVLRPSKIEKAWFPRLEQDELLQIAQMEDEFEKQLSEIQSTMAPTPVGLHGKGPGDEAGEDAEDGTIDESQQDALESSDDLFNGNDTRNPVW
eukprot:CAMPEP_0117753570 /NCGR_PEP_ID=MMETSP0947-20121206/12309_1 /TAXON_ID=44440 /ORGANISM="Chattonella subsalsa, Strain CCMP2191" /LENGTH=100 /DNA_ID=CAMNT_0005572487 /DNA_START=137 /DNA_END=436 /DNA_ORIENTATION=-